MRSMKWLLGFSLSYFAILSTGCMKNCWNKNIESKQVTFTFRAGDSTYIWNGDYTDDHAFGARSTLGSSSGRDVFTIYAKGFNGDGLEIALYTSKFQQGQNSNILDSQSLEMSGIFQHKTWEFDPHNNTSNLTITSIHDNLADGLFEGTITQGSNKEQATISHGEFHNVKIYN